MTKSQLFQWVGVFISLAVVALLVRSLHIDQVMTALAEADYWWLVPATVASLVSFAVRAQRFRLLLVPIREFSLWRAYRYIAINYMGNNVLPARAGEVLLSYVVRRQEGIAVSSSLAVTVLGRVVDGVLLLLLLCIAVLLLPFPDWVDRVLLAGLTVFGLALAGLLWLVFGKDDHHRQLLSVIQAVSPQIFERLVRFGTKQIKGFQQGLLALRQRHVAGQGIGLTIFIWICEGLVYYFVGQAVAVDQTIWQWLFVLAITNLAATIPSGPASIGTFEGVVIVALGLSGVSLHQAAAYALLLHVTQVLPVTLIGALAYAHLSVRGGAGRGEQAASLPVSE